jgi:hypothetical protein
MRFALPVLVSAVLLANLSPCFADELDRMRKSALEQVKTLQDPSAPMDEEQTRLIESADLGQISIPHTRPLMNLPEWNNPELKATVLEPGEDIDLFQRLAAQRHIPFEYPDDGCYARAHEMTMLLEKKRIVAVKFFVEQFRDHFVWKKWRPGRTKQGLLRVDTSNSPDGYVNWIYHVAPMVLVKGADGKVEGKILDPSIADHPLSWQEWMAKQTIPDPKHPPVYGWRSRFFYGPGKGYRLADERKDKHPAIWDPANIQDTFQTLNQYRFESKKRKDGVQDAAVIPASPPNSIPVAEPPQ